MMHVKNNIIIRCDWIQVGHMMHYLQNSTCFWGQYWFLIYPEVIIIITSKFTEYIFRLSDTGKQKELLEWLAWLCKPIILLKT